MGYNELVPLMAYPKGAIMDEVLPSKERNGKSFRKDYRYAR